MEETPAGELERQLRRLDSLVNWERSARTAMRQNLEPMRDLLLRLDSPEKRFRAVHVGGTKGKGSVTALLAHGLLRAGLPTGQYLSPHLQRIQERIEIGGEPVRDSVLAQTLDRSLSALEEAREQKTAAADATWFDAITCAAFCAFASSRVAWAAVEVGLGGRLDSTNVVDAPVCVLTNVDLEHVEVLGATRARIAREKAGILRETTRSLVTGLYAEDEAGAVLDARAKELGLRVLRPEQEVFARATLSERNLALASLAMDELGRLGLCRRGGGPVGAELLDPDVQSASRLPGRMEILSYAGKTLVLDGGHVPASVSAVLAELRQREELALPPVAILGLRRDKDLQGILKALVGGVDRVFCTPLEVGPFWRPDEMVAAAERLGMAAQAALSPRHALQEAIEATARKGWVLATGSFYLVGAIRSIAASSQAC
jgi:dihydrofolate synthase/folylpolyglutamate synthase